MLRYSLRIVYGGPASLFSPPRIQEGLMSRIWLLAATSLVVVLHAASAQAHKSSSRHANHTHFKAAKVRYGGHLHVGYWRPGPARGPRFGFSSYKGDPFGSDDYYDGRQCYYVHHRNFCVHNHIFTGFD